MVNYNNRLSSLSVFFPCYNEEKNFPFLVKTCLSFLPQITDKFEIIVINDGSIDNTGKLADRLSSKHSNIRVIHHEKNLGYGASIRSGIRHAKFDWIFFTDGDRQFNINQLKDFIPHTTDYQAVIGYRTRRAEGFLRAFNARLFKLFVDALFRLHVKDIDCAFKLFSREVVQPLNLTSIGAMISAEILYKLKKHGVKFKQLPVTHLPRQYGSSTGNNPKVVLRAGFEAIKLYVHMKFGKLNS